MSLSNQNARILIADDEETFASNLANYLQREGYECETAPDGTTAAMRLRRNQFDLLIADLHMPGNEGLELLQDSAVAGTAVLLVTGSPTLDSALESFRLPVRGYLVKPFRFTELEVEVEKALHANSIARSMASAKERLHRWIEELETLEKLPHNSASAAHLSMQAYVEATVRHVTETLIDLARVTAMTSGHEHHAAMELEGEVDLCRVVDCPRLAHYRTAIDETIETLAKTKNAFKSKELGTLRRKLEILKKMQTT